MIHSLYILNRAGGLIYQQDYSNVLNKLSINDYLVFAGTIHGVHAIASKLTPPQVKDASSLLSHGTAGPKVVVSSPNVQTHTASNPPRMASFSSFSNDHHNSSSATDNSRINKILANFTNLNNPQITNSSLLSNSSISYNKLNSNFFYMNNNTSGLNIVETGFFNIFIFQTLTGVKFILITSPNIHEKRIGEPNAGHFVLSSASAAKDPSNVSKDHHTIGSRVEGGIASITSLPGSNASLGDLKDANGGALKKNLNSDYNSAEELLRKIYVVYSDYVMKNPFYSLDMPIKADLFDSKVKDLILGF